MKKKGGGKSKDKKLYKEVEAIQELLQKTTPVTDDDAMRREFIIDIVEWWLIKIQDRL